MPHYKKVYKCIPRGTSSLVGVCGPLPKTLTQPIYDQTLRFSLTLVMTGPKIQNPIYEPVLDLSYNQFPSSDQC